MEHTDEFLKDLLETYGNDYFVKFFGSKARNRLSGFGGTESVAIALSGNFLTQFFLCFNARVKFKIRIYGPKKQPLFFLHCLLFELHICYFLTYTNEINHLLYYRKQNHK